MEHLKILLAAIILFGANAFGANPNLTFGSVTTPGIIDRATSTSLKRTITVSFQQIDLTQPQGEVQVIAFLRQVSPTVGAWNQYQTTFNQSITGSTGGNQTLCMVSLERDTQTGIVEITFEIDFTTTPDGQYRIDVSCSDWSATGQGLQVESIVDAGRFEIGSNLAGSSQNNPILPDSIDADGNFIFNAIPGEQSLWVDPPLAFGYVYQTFNSELIKSIDGLPTGIDGDGLFTLHTPDLTYLNVSVSDTFDFSTNANGGIRWFAITDVGPAVDATVTNAFPIQMTFTGAASLCVTPLQVPDVVLNGPSILLSSDPRPAQQQSAYNSSLTWNAQRELSYQVEIFDTDSQQWIGSTTLTGYGYSAEGTWLNYWEIASGATATSLESTALYRIKAQFSAPVLKIDPNSGTGPVIVTYNPPPFLWPFGINDPFTDFLDGFNSRFQLIQHANSTSDTNGFGLVAEQFRMSLTEVSRSMIGAYNLNSGTGSPAITMNDMTSLGGNGPDQPATGISWNEAARFVNWLNSSQGHAEAYKFIGTGPNDGITAWTAGDTGYNTSNPYRNSGAFYFLPSEDEWYKAAYHKLDGSGYHLYPTGSDTAPTAVASGGSGNVAVWQSQIAPASVLSASGTSPSGVLGMAGNIAEWTESAFDKSNDLGSENRTVRGGAWNSVTGLHSADRQSSDPTLEDDMTGFRFAAKDVPIY